MASQSLMSKVDPNHDGRESCGICWHFSHFNRVSQMQRYQSHSTEGLKIEIAKRAKQFIGRRQHDPSEYIEQIVRQCTAFQELTTHQSFSTYTCMSCNEKSHSSDVRNILIQPLKKEDENLSLGHILSSNSVTTCHKICESCDQDRLHQMNEELLIHPSVLIINLQRFTAHVEEASVGFNTKRKSP